MNKLVSILLIISNEYFPVGLSTYLYPMGNISSSVGSQAEIIIVYIWREEIWGSSHI
jgi:hypothetical protein